MHLMDHLLLEIIHQTSEMTNGSNNPLWTLEELVISLRLNCFILEVQRLNENLLKM